MNLNAKLTNLEDFESICLVQNTLNLPIDRGQGPRILILCGASDIIQPCAKANDCLYFVKGLLIKEKKEVLSHVKYPIIL
jgi:hypothetical protein